MKDSIRPETMLPFVQRWNGRLMPVRSPFRVQASSQGTNAGMKMQSSLHTWGSNSIPSPPPFPCLHNVEAPPRHFDVYPLQQAPSPPPAVGHCLLLS